MHYCHMQENWGKEEKLAERGLGYFKNDHTMESKILNTRIFLKKFISGGNGLGGMLVRLSRDVKVSKLSCDLIHHLYLLILLVETVKG